MAITYSPEFKASIIARMLPPNDVPVPDLVRETNIPKDTLYAWRAKARKEAQGVAAPLSPTAGLSSEEKFAVVVESATLNEIELGEYCRRKGLYPEQIQRWREAAAGGNDDTQRPSDVSCRLSARRRVGWRRSSGARTRRSPRAS